MPSDVALLRTLRRAGDRAVCVADLARELGLTPAALNARLRALRIAGFEIDACPEAGLRLLTGPRDRLVADDLRARLPEDCTVGREIVVLAETNSTNDAVARAGAGGAAEGLVIFAERQHAGRGRQGRHWSSEPGLGLWFSVLLRPRAPSECWSGLALLAALAVAEAAATVTGANAQIKWPNDVLVRGRKIAGILIETHLAATTTKVGRRGHAVMGIGINVSHRVTDFPEEIRDRATSVAQVAGAPVDRPALAVAVLHRLEALYESWQREPDSIVAACDARCSLHGRRVRSAADPQLGGRVTGFDARGRLRLRHCETGEVLTIGSGEIVLMGNGDDTVAQNQTKTETGSQ